MNQENMMSDKWGWYNSLYILADEKIDKLETITKLGLKECLTFMCYKQDINTIKTQQHEQQMRRYGR